ERAKRVPLDRDADSRAAIEASFRPGNEIIQRYADCGRGGLGAFECEACRFRRSIDGNAAGPRRLARSDIAGFRRLLTAPQRQIEDSDARRAGKNRGAAARHPLPRVDGGIDIRVEPARLDLALSVLADIGNAKETRVPTGDDADRVGWLECQPA